MKKIEIKKQNYLGLNIEKAEKRLNAKYLNDVKMKEGPVGALFKSNGPDRSQGHKNYAILFVQNDMLMVTGRDRYSFKMTGVLCPVCKTALYSLTRHNFHKCGCANETMIDGGQEAYYRYGGDNFEKIKLVDIYPLTGRVKLKSEKA